MYEGGGSVRYVRKCTDERGSVWEESEERVYVVVMYRYGV